MIRDEDDVLRCEEEDCVYTSRAADDPPSCKVYVNEKADFVTICDYCIETRKPDIIGECFWCGAMMVRRNGLKCIPFDIGLDGLICWACYRFEGPEGTAVYNEDDEEFLSQHAGEAHKKTDNIDDKTNPRQRFLRAIYYCEKEKKRCRKWKMERDIKRAFPDFPEDVTTCMVRKCKACNVDTSERNNILRAFVYE